MITVILERDSTQQPVLIKGQDKDPGDVKILVKTEC